MFFRQTKSQKNYRSSKWDPRRILRCATLPNLDKRTLQDEICILDCCFNLNFVLSFKKICFPSFSRKLSNNCHAYTQLVSIWSTLGPKKLGKVWGISFVPTIIISGMRSQRYQRSLSQTLRISEDS